MRIVCKAWLVILVCCGLCSLWAVHGLGADFQTLKEHRLAYDAHQKLEKEEYQECIQILTPYIFEHERPASSLFVLYAQAQSGLGQIKAALDIYSRAAGLYPENVIILRNYAVTSRRAGLLSQAARLFERASAQGGPQELLYQAGAAWYEAKEYARAGQVMLSLLSATKKTKREWVKLLVYSLLQDGKWKQAADHVQRLIRRRPNDSTFWKLLAHIRSQQDDLLGAASALDLAYHLSRPGKKKWRDLASMYAAAGVPLMAVMAMHKGLEDTPDPEHCWRMGRLYAQALRTDRAVEWMNRALSGKDNPSWHLDKANLLYTHERYARCREAAIEAAGSSPQLRGRAWLLAGYAAWQEQDWRGAKEAFSRAQKVEETAAQASACLQTVKRILESERKVRLAGDHTGLSRTDSTAAMGFIIHSNHTTAQHS